MRKISFVNVTLDVATEIILEDSLLHEEDALDWLMGLPEKGYKVSMSYNEERNSFIASMTGGPGTKNDGLCTTQWGKSVASCARKLHLVHEVICRGDNWGVADGLIADILRDALKGFKAN
ncbi:MAG: hypothetical protein [Circular genetic element sp.]|nr:MAG: hypothetical protein [Circular genetic element sp.]